MATSLESMRDATDAPLCGATQATSVCAGSLLLLESTAFRQSRAPSSATCLLARRPRNPVQAHVASARPDGHFDDIDERVQTARELFSCAYAEADVGFAHRYSLGFVLRRDRYAGMNWFTRAARNEPLRTRWPPAKLWCCWSRTQSSRLIPCLVATPFRMRTVSVVLTESSGRRTS